MTELDLRETLERHLGGVEVPPGDPLVAIDRGQRRRRRRRVLRTGAAVLALVAVAGSGGVLLVGGDDDPDTAHYTDAGPLDLAHGARAYASPGEELHLGGRTFPGGDREYLDTDAVATSYGLVFYDRGRPMLLGADGEVTALLDGPVDEGGDFHPTAKVDSKHPWVAFATRRGMTTTITIRDLASDRTIDSTSIDCESCDNLAVVAFDDGMVFVRVDQLIQTWDVSTGKGHTVSEGGTQITDVRNHVVLYDGKPPTMYPPGYRGRRPWTLVKGPVEASLTFDGRYVLDWSSRLRATDGGPDLVLDAGPTKGLGFWAIDSDGSVLVAAPDGAYPHYLVYDCEVPSGDCEQLGPLVTTSGDPEFIGADG